VRGVDFGLARARAGDDSLGSAPPSPSVEPSSALATSLTRAGAVVGTPRYMAPEQLGDGELTAAADQFSFCVTLWEALYGRRPFDGRTAAEISANVLAGRLRAPPKARKIPGWLRRACERGLAVDPALRWPSMGALLDTLAKGRTRAGIRKGLAVAGVLVLVGAGAEARRRWDVAQRVAACETTADELSAVWSPEREQALRKALVATGVSFAPRTADAVVPWIDGQAEAWREARVELCLDADVRDRWDADLLDRSLWCLDARRAELQTLVEELTLADAEVVHKAVAVASALVPVAACRDARALETIARPPELDRDKLRAVRADVARAGNLERAGRYARGLELARNALVRAEALAWPPLAAEARLQLGSLLERSGAYAEAEAELERTYFDASKGVAPDVAFDAACRLVRTVGVSAARPVEGLRWARLADIALEDVHDGQHLRRASLLTNLATVHRLRGEYGAARREHEQALAILEQALGGEHLRVVASLINLANVHAATRNDADAKQLYLRAMAIQEAVLEPDHPEVAATLNNLANAYSNTGDHEEAKRLLQRTVSIWEHTLGSTHPSVAMGLNNLGGEHYATGDYEGARPLFQRALEIWERALGPEHPDVATSLTNLGNTYRHIGDLEQARVRLERAAAIVDEALGPEHPMLVTPLGSLAEIALAEGRASDALPLVQRMVSLREQEGAPARELAEARFLLARALWDAPADAGGDPARAIDLAEEARTVLRDAGARESEGAFAESLPAVERWLAEHRDAPAAPP
jgi:eukaryotic-like serine/threonine-protein kinase